MDLQGNPNTRWSSIFVDELVASGLQEVCIAPGSRSTPLTLAFSANPSIRIYRHLDERSAAFFALGLAKGMGRPVALVCTSGTAAANFFPAIIEAYYSRIPLLILTADRPPELRQSGANQTIDQIKLYGDHVRWSVDVPVPREHEPEIVIRHIRTLAARAYAEADGIVSGPVHLNFPFRQPLEPAPAPLAMEQGNESHRVREAAPHTRIIRGRLSAEPPLYDELAEQIMAHPRGVIVCSPECPRGSFAEDVVKLSLRAGYPIFADPLSNLRFGQAVSSQVILGGYHHWLPSMNPSTIRPDVILRFGALPASKVLGEYILGSDAACHVHVRENGQWADDQHLTGTLLQLDPAGFCRELTSRLSDQQYAPDIGWLKPFIEAESTAWSYLEAGLGSGPFFDGAVVHRLISGLPDDTLLFAGNSLPVRLVDWFGRPSARRLGIHANRGASGIDGNVSTALGLAAASGKHVVAVLGDITFYHDLNGLLAIRQNDVTNITFLVLNNDGGGIFRRLPIAGHEPPFSDLFLMSHGLSFEPAADMYGLEYAPVAGMDSLQKLLDEGLPRSRQPLLIEVALDGVRDYEEQQALSRAIGAGVCDIGHPR